MKQFAVVGLGRFGMAVARHLSQRGFQVLAIDRNPRKVAEAAEFVTRALELNATDEDSLRDSRIQKVDAAVVGIGKDISASILITLILKNFGIKTVFSKASWKITQMLLYIIILKILRSIMILIAHVFLIQNMFLLTVFPII